MPTKQNKKKKEKKSILWLKVTVGFSLMGTVALVSLSVTQSENFQGFTRIGPSIVRDSADEVKLGTILGHYEMSNESLSNNQKGATISQIQYDIANEPIEIETFVFEMEGDASSTNFENIQILVAGEKVSKINTIWEDNFLFLHVIGEPVTVEEGKTEIVVLADIAEGISGQTAAFHLADLNATGVYSNKQIFGYGLNGALVPSPQLLIFE